MRVFAVAAFALTFGLAGGLARAADHDATVVNRTGVTINHVYVSVAGANAWDEDLLDEDDTLDNGEHVDIAFDKEVRGCLYDLKVVYEEGETSQWGGINLCETRRIGIYWDRKAGTTRAAAESE